jgi:hypothetical protein
MATFNHEWCEANGEALRSAKSSTYLEAGRHVWFLETPGGLNILVNYLSLN